MANDDDSLIGRFTSANDKQVKQKQRVDNVLKRVRSKAVAKPVVKRSALEQGLYDKREKRRAERAARDGAYRRSLSSGAS